MDYMSTEESGVDDGEDIFMVYERPWESERFRRYKLSLLEEYEKDSRPGQFKARRRKRNIVASARPPPERPIQWAVKNP